MLDLGVLPTTAGAALTYMLDIKIRPNTFPATEHKFDSSFKADWQDLDEKCMTCGKYLVPMDQIPKGKGRKGITKTHNSNATCQLNWCECLPLDIEGDFPDQPDIPDNLESEEKGMSNTSGRRHLRGKQASTTGNTRAGEREANPAFEDGPRQERSETRQGDPQAYLEHRVDGEGCGREGEDGDRREQDPGGHEGQGEQPSSLPTGSTGPT